ncbi:MAG: c-type cytochrome [Terriglobia bacterium]
MKKAKRILLAGLTAVLAAQVLGAWPWSIDMVYQLFVRPQQQALAPAAGSIPVGWEAPLARAQASAARNPLVPGGDDNLERGRVLYGTYCFACHGAEGQGDGPVVAGALRPTDLTDARIRRQSDGELYATIRHGLGTMPAYYDRLAAEERWQVVLYVRQLQGAGTQ